MDYDALTFDTQTVETNSFHFDGGLLAQLKQFKDGPIDVVVSLVVIAEITRHLRDKTLSAKDALESAYKKAQLYGLKATDDKAFADPPDAQDLSRKRLLQYLREIGATGVSPNDVPMRDLVRTYVQRDPPFAGSGKKKNEFPDAIALLSLELWAKSNDKRILAVSGDGDWAAFAEKSEWIDVVAALSDALARLQQDADEAEAIVEKLLGDMKAGRNQEFADKFETFLSDEVSMAIVQAEADSAYSFEGQVEDLTLNHYEFQDNNGVFSAQIVQFGRSIIVASIPLSLRVTADATFSLSTYDSVDGDRVGLGTSSVRKEDEEVEVTVLVTFEGNFTEKDITLTKVELTDGLKSIHFGEVEIDYGEPDYDDLSMDDDDGLEVSIEPSDENPF